MRTVVLGLGAALALVAGAPALAEGMTPQALADRAEIEDILTRYYNNFGNNAAEYVGQYYAEDGEMVLGTTHYKGAEAIKGMYKAVPADAPQRKSFALNILIGNPLIVVNGDTATARLVYTEYAVEKEGDAPRILTMGREFDHFVKRGGKWLILKREILGPKGVPEGWED